MARHFRKGILGRTARAALPVALAAALLLAVRGLLLTQVSVGGGTPVKGLEKGGRALVSLTWYGLRLPGEKVFGPRRWGYGAPQRGEALAFRRTGDDRLRVGVCRAVWADGTYNVEVTPGHTERVPHEALVGRLVCRVFPHGWRTPWFERFR